MSYCGGGGSLQRLLSVIALPQFFKDHCFGPLEFCSPITVAWYFSTVDSIMYKDGGIDVG